MADYSTDHDDFKELSIFLRSCGIADENGVTFLWLVHVKDPEDWTVGWNYCEDTITISRST